MWDDLDYISFAEWLIDLNRKAVKAGYDSNCGLTEITGQFCWYSFYEAAVSPEDALLQAVIDGGQYEQDYLI